MKIKITERGWAGHFIGGDKCLFRRNTLLEADNHKIVVSTVGGMMINDKLQTIGYLRYYETMAFPAKIDGSYIEAETSNPLEFGSKWAITADEPSKLPSDVDNQANDMHDAVVLEFKKYLKKTLKKV